MEDAISWIGSVIPERCRYFERDEAREMIETHYELDPTEREARMLQRRVITELYLMPFDPLDPRKITELSLSKSEVSDFMQAIAYMAIGHVRQALICFRYGLLPESSEHGSLWHTAVLLWCALLSLYDCDPLPALEYVAQAEENSPLGETPEIRMVKGMAKRLSGDLSGAVESFRLAHSHPGRYKDIVQAWMLESEAVAGSRRVTAQQIKSLENKDVVEYSGYIGILSGVLYRLLITSGLRPKGIRAPDEILVVLDNVHVAERPMLTMLLQDILPRPLKGVVKAEDFEKTRGWEGWFGCF